MRRICLGLLCLIVAVLLPVLAYAAPGRIPGTPQFDNLIARARAAFANQNYGQADVMYSAAIRSRESAGPGDDRLVTSLYELGVLREIEGRSSASSNLFLRAIAILEKSAPAGNYDLSDLWAALAKSYYSRHLYAKAQSGCRRALEIESAARPPRDFRVAMLFSDLGAVYEAERKYPEAEAALKRGLAALGSDTKTNRLEAATLSNNIGAIYLQEGLFDEAEDAFRRGLTLLDLAGQGDGLVAAYLLNSLGSTAFRRGDYSGAAAWFGKSAALIDGGAPVGPTFHASVLRSYALCLRKLGKKSEAHELEHKSSALRASVPEDRERQMVVDASELATQR
jgi:tetratricopeptide (TPR) repeat protein